MTPSPGYFAGISTAGPGGVSHLVSWFLGFWFLGFMDRLAQGCQGVVARDGKTLRRWWPGTVRRCAATTGRYDRAEGGSPLHLVNAWAAEQRLALGQMAVAGKSNEITAR